MGKWICQFYGSSIGKKVIVAVTGLAMVGWLAGHLLGNLQIFAGRGATVATTKLNEYSEFLHQNVALLWGVRFAMIGAIVLHIVTTVKLTFQNSEARPRDYDMKKPLKSTLASRTMIWGGIFLFLYIIYHILHLTTGTFHADLYTHGDVYENAVRSFQNPLIVAIYLTAQAFLFLHLSHGFQSTFRTLGVSHSRYIDIIKTTGYGVCAAIVLGFASIPIAIYMGWVS